MRFEKTTAYDILSVEIDDPRMRIENWHEDGVRVNITTVVQHTFRDEEFKANLLIHRRGHTSIVVPVLVTVREFVFVTPASVFFGLLAPGQKASRVVTVTSDQRVDVLTCQSDLQGCECIVRQINDSRVEIELVYTPDGMSVPGAFDGRVEVVSGFPGGPLLLGIHGVIVGRESVSPRGIIEDTEIR